MLFETLLPRIALDLNADPPADLNALFPAPVRAVRLEIGFGGGEHLVAEAARHPNIGFIGCEAFVNGIAKLLTQIDAQQIENVRIHPGDVLDLLRWLPSASLSQVDVLYPDPWPKRRHWKRRLIQPDTVAQLGRVLRPNGLFRFATDIPDYAEWTLLRVLRSGLFSWTAERADDWRKPWPEFAGTRYETKAREAGRTPCYLSFRRKD